MEMPGAMSMYFMQFRAITVTWTGNSIMQKQPYLWVENLLRLHGSSHGPSVGSFASEGTTRKLSLTFFKDPSNFLVCYFYIGFSLPLESDDSEFCPGGMSFSFGLLRANESCDAARLQWPNMFCV